MDYQTKKRLWDNGLKNDYIFTKSYNGYRPIFTKRSRSCPGGHDNPLHRFIIYVILSLHSFIGSLFLIFLSWTIREFILWAIFYIIFSILLFLIFLTFFRSALFLYRAKNSKGIPNFEDPFRVRTINRGIKWGIKKGLIKKDEKGSWEYYPIVKK